MKRDSNAIKKKNVPSRIELLLELPKLSELSEAVPPEPETQVVKPAPTNSRTNLMGNRQVLQIKVEQPPSHWRGLRVLLEPLKCQKSTETVHITL